MRGSLPQPQQPPTASEAASGNGGGPGRWLTPEEAREANEEAASARQRGKVRPGSMGDLRTKFVPALDFFPSRLPSLMLLARHHF